MNSMNGTIAIPGAAAAADVEVASHTFAFRFLFDWFQASQI